jgi:hypothetical protein
VLSLSRLAVQPRFRADLVHCLLVKDAVGGNGFERGVIGRHGELDDGERRRDPSTSGSGQFALDETVVRSDGLGLDKQDSEDLSCDSATAWASTMGCDAPLGMAGGVAQGSS